MFPDHRSLPGSIRTLQKPLLFVCLLLSCGVALAMPAPGNQSAMLAEVKYLLTFVEASDCQFNRNDIWHDGKEARAHLETKYEYLVKRNAINSAEDFIAKAATKSSLSGREYEIRCPNGKALTSARWLSDELLRYRRAMEH
ncbi:MAG: DUF5329 domain-containing protein [Burkholderiales bacterium]|nr:DUF5329 domain-containing protein [Burkholderiales bacterium]